LPKDALPLLTFYEKLYTATGGLVTPLIGAMMVEAGYDELYSFKPQKLVSPPAWQNVLSYDPHSLTVSESVLLDFGAAGKGYLVDLLSQLIEEAGAETYVIDAGGDIVQCSADNASTAIGMENPIDATQVIGKVDLCNQSLCASAGSRRNWGKYHHIIDPQTRCSPSTITATWVIADDTMTADGLATALFFVEPARLLRTFHFEFAVLSVDMSLEYSQGFPATLFKAEAV
jgi:thiamine biosynthesis lipoprotein